MIIFDLASQSKFEANRESPFTILNIKNSNIKNSWSNFMDLVTKFLDHDDFQSALIVDSSKISKIEPLLTFLIRLNEQSSSNIDLFQIQHNSSRILKIRPIFDSYYWYHDITKIIPSSLVSYQIVYNLWLNLNRKIFRCVYLILNTTSAILPRKVKRKIMSRVNSILAIRIAKNVGDVMNFLEVKSEIIFHSFEEGLECFIISRRLAEHLETVNNPPLLDLNTLLSAVARTQNLRSFRFLGNPFK